MLSRKKAGGAPSALRFPKLQQAGEILVEVRELMLREYAQSHRIHPEKQSRHHREFSARLGELASRALVPAAAFQVQSGGELYQRAEEDFRIVRRIVSHRKPGGLPGFMRMPVV